MSFAGKRAMVCMKHVGLNGRLMVLSIPRSRHAHGSSSWFRLTTRPCILRKTSRIPGFTRSLR